MFLILMVALLALVGSSLEGFMDRASPSPVYSCIGRINQCTYLIVSKLALPLFGIRAREHAENEDDDEQDNSLASAIQNTKKEMISEMAALEEVRSSVALGLLSITFFCSDSVFLFDRSACMSTWPLWQ